MRLILILVSLIFFVGGGGLAFTLGRTNPDGYNIVFIHVPNSIAALLCFVIILVAGIGYLKTRNLQWDRLGAAAAEVGLIAATIMNATGSLFAKLAWGVWWNPTPRLITSAILWFLYIAYFLLRHEVKSPQRRGIICAVFGIIAFLDVPLVYLSARFTNDMHIANFEGIATKWGNASFGCCILGTLFLAAALIWMKTELLKHQDTLQGDLENN